MSDLVMMDNVKTMSSVEIAELTGKRHDNVMRVAKRLRLKGIINAPQIEERYNKNNFRIVCYLNKTESLNLVANLSPEFTAAIIDRWQELESQAQKPTELSRMDLIQLAMKAEEERLALAEQVEEMKPAVVAMDRLAGIEQEARTLTETAKQLNTNVKKLTTYMKENKWIYKRTLRSNWLAYQTHIDQKLLTHKTTIISVTGENGETVDREVHQVRVTRKGFVKLAKGMGVALDEAA